MMYELLFSLGVLTVIGAVGWWRSPIYDPPESAERRVSAREALQFAIDNKLPLKNND